MMNQEQTFWAVQFGIAMMGVCTLIVMLSTYWNNHNNIVHAMIDSGIPPVAVMCALQNDYGDMPVCLVLATKSIKGE